jgi:sugar phosphate isomerase/epimerase
MLAAVHVKDRTTSGPSCPLGTGHADLPRFFARLLGAGYTGDFILQPYFGADHVADARRHHRFVKAALGQAAHGPGVPSDRSSLGWKVA